MKDSKYNEEAPLQTPFEIKVNDRSWSFIIFQAATAAMLAGFVVATLTAASTALDSGPKSSKLMYSSVLSAAICAVAYVNYSAMGRRRLITIEKCKGRSTTDYKTGKCMAADELDQFELTVLRYSDWVITMPLLSLKLLDLASDGPCPLSTGLLEWRYVQALIGGLAMVMISSGFLALIATGDFEAVSTDNRCSAAVRWSLYSLGLGCLVMIYYLLFLTATEAQSVHIVEVHMFALLWIGYPIVFVLQMFRLLPGIGKDILFSILDVLSKPLLAVYICQTALNRVLQDDELSPVCV